MTDPNTRNKVRRAHERREQSGDTEGLHMDDEQPVAKQTQVAEPADQSAVIAAPPTWKGDPGCP